MVANAQQMYAGQPPASPLSPLYSGYPQPTFNTNPIKPYESPKYGAQPPSPLPVSIRAPMPAAVTPTVFSPTAGPLSATQASGTGGFLVHFHCICTDTQPGDVVCVVGGNPELGKWDITKALMLETAPGLFPLWIGKVYVTGEQKMNYKFAIRNTKTGATRWEGLEDNRVCDSMGHEIQIYESFNARAVRREVIYRAPVPQPVPQLPAPAPSADLTRVIDMIGQLRHDLLQGGRTLSDAGAVLRQKDNEIASLRCELERVKAALGRKEHDLNRLRLDLDTRK